MNSAEFKALKSLFETAVLAADSAAKRGASLKVIAAIATKELVSSGPKDPVSTEEMRGMERGFLLGSLWAGDRPRRECRRKLRLASERFCCLGGRLEDGTLDEDGAELLKNVAAEISMLVAEKKAGWDWSDNA